MSSDATGWTFGFSPAKDKTFAVHLAIADSVNDQNENEFWMTIGRLAEKARVSRGTAQRAVRWLADHDLIECADGTDDPWKSGKAVRYRFLFPEIPVVFEARRSRTMRDLGPGVGRAPRATRSRTMRDPGPAVPLPIETQEEPKCSSPTGDTDAETFDHFWSEWPARHGKKLAKGKAFAVWKRLTMDERRAAWRGARHYAAASDSGMAGAKDAFRWLHGREWDDWQEPAVPTRARNGTSLDPVADLFDVEFDEKGRMVL